MQSNLLRVVNILFMYRTRINLCSTMLCEYILYCSCVITLIEFYVSQQYFSGY
jgi:hypothetical protein